MDARTQTTAHGALAEHVARLLVHRAETIRANRQAAIAGTEAEAVHDMRVSARRLRAALSVFAGQLPAREARRLDRRLKRLLGQLGATREVEVECRLLEALHDASDDRVERAAVEHVLEHHVRRLRKDRARLPRVLSRLEIDDLPRHASRLAATIALGLGELDPWAVLAPRVEAAFGDAGALRVEESVDGLHGMRLGVKRLRYAIELLAPAFRDADPLLARCRDMQEVLGDHHDAAVLESRLRALGAALDARGRAVLGAAISTLGGRVAARREACWHAVVVLVDGLDAASFGLAIRAALSGDLAHQERVGLLGLTTRNQ